MQPRGPGPGIDHRVRVMFPTPIGDDVLRIIGFGVRELIAPAVIDRPQGTDEWLVMAFHGSAHVWVGTSAQAVPADSLVVWRPHAPQRYGNAGHTWLHSWMHVEGRLPATWFEGGVLPLERPVMGIPARLLDRCLLLMHSEISQQTHADAEILQLYLQVWFRSVVRALAGGQRAPAGLLAARAAIESRYGDSLDLQELAEIAGSSRQHFCTSFKMAFGTAPIQYLIRVRLQHAHLLLHDPTMGAAAAAAAVGFQDYRHFARQYRKRFGRSARGRPRT